MSTTHAAPLQDNQAITMYGGGHVCCIIGFIGTHHPAVFAMRFHTFTNKFKISSKDKITFYLIKGVMKFISAKPNIITSCFEMITLIFRIKYCIALCFGIANIIMIGKYTNRALCHDT